MFDKVHHVAVVVDDIEKAAEFFGEKFGIKLAGRYPADTYESALFPVGDFIFELIAPRVPTSRFAQALKDRGGWYLDHVGYGVSSMDKIVADLNAKEGEGFVIRGAPVVAPTGWRVCNLDPKRTGGISIQMVDLEYKG